MENENKTYLTGRKWIRGELIDLYETKGEEVVNYIMNGIIEVYSKKDYGNRALYTDLTIFDEGIFFKCINPTSTFFIIWNVSWYCSRLCC